MKLKPINMLFAGMFSIFLLSVSGSQLEADASGIDNITERSDYMYYTMWTAKEDVDGWWDGSTYRFANGTKWGGTFYAGQSYHLPYGQPITAGKYIGYGVAVADFVTATMNADSLFYTVSSYNQYNMPSNSTYYANDCSAFVSYCWDLPSRKTTYDWSGLNVTDLGKCNSTNVKKIEQGDAICRSAHHIVLVSRVNDNGTYEITEQTPPEMKRTIYSAAQLVSEYSKYNIYRYNARDYVTPPSRKSEIPAPTTSVLSLWGNDGVYAVGNTVTFRMSSDTATGYTLNIFRGSDLISTTEHTGTMCYYKPSKVGDYSAYIVAHNDNGQLQSETVYFRVYDGVPSEITISTSRKLYGTGDNVDLNFTAQNSIYYTVNVYDSNGQLCATKSTDANQYLVNVDVAGEYYCTVTAHNDVGSATSERFYFTVANVLTTANISGDINRDGIFDKDDMCRIRDYIHRRTAFTEEEYSLADLTGDGIVNVLDLAEAKHILH